MHKFRCITHFLILSVVTSLLVGCMTGNYNPRNKYRGARRINTIEAYKNFLAKYPKSMYTKGALDYLGKREWDKARLINTLHAYEGYIAAYPKHLYIKHAVNAIKRIKAQKLGAEQAIKEGTMKAYLKFSERCGRCQLSREVRDRIEEQLDDSKRFYDDIKAGNINGVHYWLDQGVDVNRKAQTQIHTPLIFAAWLGHTDIAQALIEKGANLNAKTDERWGSKTALAVAAENGHTETVKMLADKGADLNMQGLHGQTAMMLALERGHAKTVQALINKGADLNVQDRDGKAALMLALEKGQTQITQALIDKGTDPKKKDRDGRTNLMVALASGNKDAIQALIDKGAKLKGQDKWGWTALMWAAKGGQTNTVRMLIENGFDMNRNYNWDVTPLIVAAMGGHVETIKFLVEKGADLNAQDKSGWTSIMWAAWNGHASTVELLQNIGANTALKDRNGMSLSDITILAKVNAPPFQTEVFKQIFNGDLSRPLEGFGQGEDKWELEHLGINSIIYTYVKRSYRRCGFKTVNKPVEKTIGGYDLITRDISKRFVRSKPVPLERINIIDEAMIPLYNTARLAKHMVSINNYKVQIDKRIVTSETDLLFSVMGCKTAGIRQFQRNLIHIYEMQGLTQ